MTCVTRERHLVTWTGCLDRLNIRNHILSEAYRNNLNFHIFTKFWVGTGWGLVPVGTGTHLDEGDPYKYTSNCIKLFSHIIFKFLNTPFCPYHFWPIRTLNITFYIRLWTINNDSPFWFLYHSHTVYRQQYLHLGDMHSTKMARHTILLDDILFH